MRRLPLVFAVFAATSTVLVPAAFADQSPNGAAHSSKAVCAQAPTGYAACHARVVTKGDNVTPNATTTYSSGYAPADLVKAYSIPATTTTRTIAIVDAFASPTAQSDLNTYRAQFGLPATTITQVNQAGGSTLPAGDTGWGQEEALDLDMASAACPSCSILYVGANSASFADLSAAVRTAAAKGASVISNSYGGSEYSGEVSAQAAYNQPNIAVTVSSGDSGYGAQFPASSQYVVDVGGTALNRSSTAGRGFTETAWSSGGSGCSAYIPKPTWQHDTGCSRRMGADVAAVADPATGVAVYDSYGSTGGANWLVFGGTSVAAPLVGGMYAVAGVTTAYPAATLYSAGRSLYDVVSGSNGRCKRPLYFCTAGTGYDGPTGGGTPNGVTSLH